MKKLLTILCLVLLSSYSYSEEVVPEVETISQGGLVYHQSSTEPFTGVVELFYENGQLKERENYKDGKLNGLWEEYYDNGQLLQRGNMKDNLQEGLWEFFRYNGQLVYTSKWKHRKILSFEYYDRENRLITDGLLENFFENGQLETRVNIKDGKPDGLQELFHENGDLLYKRYFKNGEIQIDESFHDNDQLEQRGTYKDGKEHGLIESYYENGQWGIRVIIASSFGSIFRNNCIQNGILPISLKPNKIKSLQNFVEADPRKNQLTVNLEHSKMTTGDGNEYPFEIDPSDQQKLLRGIDAIELTLENINLIKEFEHKDKKLRPWVYF